MDEVNPDDIETVDQSDESDSEFSPKDVALDEEFKETEDGRLRPSRWMRTRLWKRQRVKLIRRVSDAFARRRGPDHGRSQAFTEKYDETAKAEELCDPDERGLQRS